LFRVLIHHVYCQRRHVVQVVLYCSRCCRHFVSSPDTPTGELLDRLSAEGPWMALGDGETFEDSIVATLRDHDGTCCPQCGARVTITEESVGRLAMQVLAGW
jgi:hypothetical protein